MRIVLKPYSKAYSKAINSIQIDYKGKIVYVKYYKGLYLFTYYYSKRILTSIPINFLLLTPIIINSYYYQLLLLLLL